jgi:hypothetical protein
LLAGGVYFVYKTIRIWSNGDALETIVKSLTVFSGLSLALLLATSAAAIVVMRNFGQGLKEGRASGCLASFPKSLLTLPPL